MKNLIFFALLLYDKILASGPNSLVMDDGRELKNAWFTYDSKMMTLPQCCDGSAACSMVRISEEVVKTVEENLKTEGYYNSWFYCCGNTKRVILSYNAATLRITGKVYDHRGIYLLESPSLQEVFTDPCFQPHLGKKMLIYYKLIKLDNNPGQVMPSPFIEKVNIPPPTGCCRRGEHCEVFHVKVRSLGDFSETAIYLPINDIDSTSDNAEFTLKQTTPPKCKYDCESAKYSNKFGLSLRVRENSLKGNYIFSIEDNEGSVKFRFNTCGSERLLISNPPEFDMDINMDMDSTLVSFGKWEPWGAWSTCKSGTKTRTRFCTNPSMTNGGADCQGHDSEGQNCQDNPDTYIWIRVLGIQRVTVTVHYSEPACSDDNFSISDGEIFRLERGTCSISSIVAKKGLMDCRPYNSPGTNDNKYGIYCYGQDCPYCYISTLTDYPDTHTYITNLLPGHGVTVTVHYSDPFCRIPPFSLAAGETKIFMEYEECTISISRIVANNDLIGCLPYTSRGTNDNKFAIYCKDVECLACYISTYTGRPDVYIKNNLHHTTTGTVQYLEHACTDDPFSISVGETFRLERGACTISRVVAKGLSSTDRPCHPYKNLGPNDNSFDINFTADNFGCNVDLR